MAPTTAGLWPPAKGSEGSTRVPRSRGAEQILVPFQLSSAGYEASCSGRGTAQLTASILSHSVGAALAFQGSASPIVPIPGSWGIDDGTRRNVRPGASRLCLSKPFIFYRLVRSIEARRIKLVRWEVLPRDYELSGVLADRPVLGRKRVS